MPRISPYLPLDNPGVLHPQIWLGTWSLGGEMYGRSDLRESLALLKAAYASGLCHFDTAGFYAHGKSEELLAKALKNERRSIFISTKGGLHWRGREVHHDASPATLRQSLLASLKRLSCDYVDLYQLHWPDPTVPINVSIDALKALKKEGLIRFWGIGNLAPDQLKECCQPQEAIPHQVHFNPLHPDYATLHAGGSDNRTLNCIISPLEQGLLGDPVDGGSEFTLPRQKRYSPP